ncbi:MAG: phosphonoacetaldehyde hydrolase [Isosphaeraceae bacterium]
MPTKIRAALFDWAGTAVDYGSRAPARVFVEIFRRAGLPITEPEARAPMGLAKREHIASILRAPRVADAWRKLHGRDPADADVDRLYREFLPLQKAILAEGSDVIPGIPAAIARLRDRGIRIGSTTGYTRELMEVVVPLAARGGFDPDVVVCSDDVPEGRPAPWMNFRAAEALGVYPMGSVLVVDDTPVGIAAARNAGAIAVAVTQTGNALGLSQAEAESLAEGEISARLDGIAREFREAGADHTIRSAAELPELIDRLG